MRQTHEYTSLLRPGPLALAAALLLTLPAAAQQPGQKRFVSAEDASQALVLAARNNDEKSLVEILGRDGRRIIDSGDEAEDAAARAHFVAKFQEMHRLVAEPDGTSTLYVGAENWPTPIPLKHRDAAWFFDTDAARHEILYRRIGRNETSTIRVCQELVAAQKEFSAAHQGAYAKAVHSEPGQHGGLFWAAREGEPKSPLGPLVAMAVVTGAGTPTPYRGYCYRMLPNQGKGFAFVAYPAEYRSSGVMTFLVNQDGVVYEKDLGRGGERSARAITRYAPGTGWIGTDAHPE